MEPSYVVLGAGVAAIFLESPQLLKTRTSKIKEDNTTNFFMVDTIKSENIQQFSERNK
jgi:hypothetical protein